MRVFFFSGFAGGAGRRQKKTLTPTLSREGGRGEGEKVGVGVAAWRPQSVA
jgi:hypothetical protein